MESSTHRSSHAQPAGASFRRRQMQTRWELDHQNKIWATDRTHLVRSPSQVQDGVGRSQKQWVCGSEEPLSRGRWRLQEMLPSGHHFCRQLEYISVHFLKLCSQTQKPILIPTLDSNSSKEKQINTDKGQWYRLPGASTKKVCLQKTKPKHAILRAQIR